MWSLSGRVVSSNYVKNIRQTSTDIKKLAPKLEPFKKLIFWVPIFRGVPIAVAQKISADQIAFAAQQLYTKIKFQCFVV